MLQVLFICLTAAGLFLSLSLLGTALDAVGVFRLLGIDLQGFVTGLFAIGWLGAVASWILAKSIAMWSMKAHPYENGSDEDPRAAAGDLPALVRDIAARFRIAPPQLAVCPGDRANVFAVGWSRHRSLLVVTQALLSADRTTAVAMITQQLAKVARHDVSTLSLLHGLLNVFTIFPARLLAFLFGTSLRTSYEDDTPSDEVEVGIMVALEVCITGFASLTVRCFSRLAETRADRDALANGAGALGRTLAGLSDYPTKRVHREVFVAPFKFGANVKGALSWLSFHNPPSTRVRALGMNAAPAVGAA